jgi:hypothetical protein
MQVWEAPSDPVVVAVAPKITTSGISVSRCHRDSHHVDAPPPADTPPPQMLPLQQTTQQNQQNNTTNASTRKVLRQKHSKRHVDRRYNRIRAVSV